MCSSIVWIEASKIQLKFGIKTGNTKRSNAYYISIKHGFHFIFFYNNEFFEKTGKNPERTVQQKKKQPLHQKGNC